MQKTGRASSRSASLARSALYRSRCPSKEENEQQVRGHLHHQTSRSEEPRAKDDMGGS